MQEIEVKVLEVNVSEITSRLEALGAVRKKEVQIRALYFDTPTRDLLERREILRLRQKGQKIELCHKKPLAQGEDVKAMQETETYVTDFEATQKILLLAGFEVIREEEKTRVSYKLPDASFELDTLPNIPTYLEIEAQSRERLLELLTALGIPQEKALPWNGAQVQAHYKTHA